MASDEPGQGVRLGAMGLAVTGVLSLAAGWVVYSTHAFAAAGALLHLVVGLWVWRGREWGMEGISQRESGRQASSGPNASDASSATWLAGLRQVTGSGLGHLTTQGDAVSCGIPP